MIVRLREAALKEMDAPELNRVTVHELKFDEGHDAKSKDIDPDYPKDVPQYHGPNNPHVGNGSGPIS